MELYRKIMNRALPLFACEYWYEGEHDGLAEVTDGVFRFAPLFVYEPGRGTGVYYSVTNAAENPLILAHYFDHHHDAFFTLAEHYREACNRLRTLTTSATPDDLVALRTQVVEVWPGLAIMNMLGGDYSIYVGPQLSSKAYELRNSTDTVVYDAGIQMLELFQTTLETSVPREHVFHMSFKELMQSLETGTQPEPSAIQQRLSGYVYHGGALEVCAKETFTHGTGILFDEMIPQNMTEVTGTTAAPGRAQGMCKLVFEWSDMDKVQEGDILVAPMTTPDFMPAIKRAAAIVTDEGGVTCHAAIVSRELKKPCLIGTKVATQVLHDGDLVEVVAEKGEVRIMERANARIRANAAEA